ncbi:MAG: hypothetical protein RIQ79_2210 [Verrucomicrobiota bacterium]
MKSLVCAPAFLVLALSASAASATELKVDVNPVTERKDALTPLWENWMVPDGTQATRKFGDITVTLRKAGADTAGWTGGLWKAGYQTKGTLVSDGLVVKDGALELVLHGLSAGKHSLATYHNAFSSAPAAPCDIAVDEKVEIKGLQPTARAASDRDAASAYVEFDAVNGKDVVVSIRPAANSGPGGVVLNGFALDTPDPDKVAKHPYPETGDEHAPENVTLTWQPGKTAVEHRLYLGADAEAVAAATPGSPEFKGAAKPASFTPEGLSHLGGYYWRVDEVDAQQGVTRGEVWHFGLRHLAFPTAEGYGRFARGGRGGSVIEVTNLEDNDEGQPPVPGSYRAAIEAEGARTIVFRVSGLIKLKRACILRNGYVTIAGQTAPGDGICLANFSTGMATNDAIVRFLRVRVGDVAKKAMDGMGLGSSNDSIIDHCTISWAMDEGTSSRGGHNITFQWNIISEMLQHGYHYNAKDRTKLETHAFAGSISGDIGSYHHNLLAHCTDRNWSLAGGLDQASKYAGRLDIRNNVVYNWTARTTDGGVKDLVYANNYYKPYSKQPKFVNWLLKLDPINPVWGKERVYMAGNIMEGFDYEKDNWKAFQNGKDVMAQVRVDEPLWPSYVKEETATDAYKRVLAGVGATLPKRDVIDTRIIAEVRKGTVHYTGSKAQEWAADPGNKNSPNVPGIIDTPTDVKDAKGSPNFPWPDYLTYKVPADADHDGMPDRWESAHGLNPNNPEDRNGDFNGDGYTNLEKYLNSLTGEYSPGKK